MIAPKFLRELIREAAEGGSIAGHVFPSRFDEEPYENDQNSGLFFIGLCYVEKRPELQRRDHHLIYAREAGFLRFETEPYNGREEYFGSPVFVTPAGYSQLGVGKLQNIPTIFGTIFSYFLEHVGWPIFAGVVIVILISLFGLNSEIVLNKP